MKTKLTRYALFVCLLSSSAFAAQKVASPANSNLVNLAGVTKKISIGPTEAYKLSEPEKKDIKKTIKQLVSESKRGRLDVQVMSGKEKQELIAHSEEETEDCDDNPEFCEYWQAINGSLKDQSLQVYAGVTDKFEVLMAFYDRANNELVVTEMAISPSAH